MTEPEHKGTDPSKIPAENARIAALVDRILASKSADPTADTTAEERRIGEPVYGLYGLTPDEIAAVESGNA